MVQVQSDNKEVKSILDDLINILCENGAVFHEDMLVVCQDNYLSIRAVGDRDASGKLFDMPHDLLLPLDQFELKLTSGQVLKLAKAAAGVTPVRKKLMELMVSLYNVTGKLKDHMASNPWLLLREEKQLLEAVYKGRPDIETRGVLQRLEKGELNEAALHGFLKTRLLGCRLNDHQAPFSKVLCPLIDCMNHHLKGAPFHNYYAPDGSGGRVIIAAAQQEEGSSEFFCNYGRMDDLDLYLDYSFPQVAPFVRSVPLKVDLGECGSLEFKSYRDVADPREIPEDLRDLAFYFPIIELNESKKTALFSHILIPQQPAPMAMVRILDFALRFLNPDLGQAEREEKLLFLEDTILSENIRYYMRLYDLLYKMQNKKHFENLRLCVENQLKKLENYRKSRSENSYYTFPQSGGISLSFS